MWYNRYNKTYSLIWRHFKIILRLIIFGGLLGPLKWALVWRYLNDWLPKILFLSSKFSCESFELAQATLWTQAIFYPVWPLIDPNIEVKVKILVFKSLINKVKHFHQQSARREDIISHKNCCYLIHTWSEIEDFVDFYVISVIS